MMRDFNAHLTDNIEISKISLLRSTISNTKQEIYERMTKKERKEIKNVNSIKLNEEEQEEMLLELQDSALARNLSKQELLREFVASYIASLSVIELDELKVKLEYYTSLFPILDIKTPDAPNQKKVLEMCEEWKSQNIVELCYTLIINNILLPDSTNQEEFNSKLKATLARLDYSTLNKLLNSSINSPVIFRSIDAAGIYTQMIERDVFACTGNKELKGEALTNFSINMTLDSVGNYATDDRIAFDFVFKMSEGIGIDRNTIEAYLMEKQYAQIGANSYMIRASENLNLYATISDLYVSVPVAPGDIETQKCKISIWAKPRVANMTSEEYLAITMSTAPVMVEKFLSRFYAENIDLFGDENFFKKSIIDINSIIRFGGIGDEKELDDETVKLGGTADASKVLGEIDIDKMSLKPLILDESAQDVIDEFTDNINNVDEYREHNLSFPRGLLLYGAGGGGKTTICQNIAINTNHPKKKFFKINIHELLNSYLGNSEKHAKAIFDMVRKYRDEGYLVFLFIDEVDGLMADKEGTEAISGTRSVILQELDGLGVDNEGIILLATTNYVEKLSAPFIRRFGRKLSISNPNVKTIRKLFDLYIAKHFPNSKIDLNLDKLVNKTKEISASSGFVEAWVKEAASYFKFKKYDVLVNEVFDKTFERAKFEINLNEGRKMGFGQQ